MTIGVSLKTYFTHSQAGDWFGRVAERAAVHPALLTRDVRLFVAPTYLQILPALDAFSGTPVVVGAQNVSEYESGATTGEVTAEELAEIGVGVVEVGHAERRRLFFESDGTTAAKAAAALRAGVTPVICVGEAERSGIADAAHSAVEQLAASLVSAPAGPIIVAYEPVWAIGAAQPAPKRHIVAVTRFLRSSLDKDSVRRGSAVIYGGSAGPGMLTRLGSDADGLFLGRHAHDADKLFAVLDEADQVNKQVRGVLT
ncbi:triose-phosphate isomerase [Arthrobacter sp. HY1533]|uniref:triose-phosphate isomerase n=1 Tax=Arthrobacter sp. HY1533 TaxID=2970919 RepID=UPI0022B9D7C9|nr:triose-phosphate isomerase family protein [Arthrobacter sp. HY1533]